MNFNARNTRETTARRGIRRERLPHRQAASKLATSASTAFGTSSKFSAYSAKRRSSSAGGSPKGVARTVPQTPFSAMKVMTQRVA